MARSMAPRISLIYALVGLAWIGGSSLIVWADSPAGPALAEIAKGAAFVVVTAGLIHALVRRGERELSLRNRRISDLHALLGGILDESHDLVAAWGRDKRLTVLNPRCRQEILALFGTCPDIGATLADVCGNAFDRCQGLDAALDRMLSGGRFTRIHCIEGLCGTRWYEISFSPLMRDGEIAGGFFIARDTTDRIVAENQLIDRKKRLQAIIDNLADYVVIIGGDLSNRSYSAGITRVTGFSEEEALGQDLASYVHPDDVEPVRSAILGSIADGRPVRDLQYRRRHADGVWHFHVLNGGRLEQGGETVFLAVVQNIDDRKLAEDKLAHSAKLATAGEFAAGLAHELAHPVAVIRLAAEGALEQCRGDPRLSPALLEQLELVDDQAQRMASLIEHVRSFSRTGSTAAVAFSPQQTLRSVERMVRKQMEIDAIVLQTDLCPAGVQVSGNPVRLEEALLNLVSNARAAIEARKKTAPEGYQGRIRLICRCDDGMVVLSVQDNGRGIDPAVSTRIFEPFFTDRGGGLGLGLSISTSIVKSFGGAIGFHSVPGETEFQLQIPVIGSGATDTDDISFEWAVRR